MKSYASAMTVALTQSHPPIAWTETGSGSPVLLVMGKSFDSRMWHRAVPDLATRHRVLTYDNRGMGRSRTRAHSFSIADLASDALAVLDAAGVERAHVYGASMGGLVVQELARQAPHRVRSIVLGCTGAPDGNHEPPRRPGLLAHVFPRWLLIRLFKRAFVRAMYGSNPPAERVREDLDIIASTHAPTWVIDQQCQAITWYESHSWLPALRVPALVLHGTADRVVAYQSGQELASRINGAKFVALPGAGHNYLSECQELANGAVLNFLAAIDAQSATN